MTGCLQYQFATVSGNLTETARNEHVLENDTLIIKYVFGGANCPVTIYIQNKLGVPLYVDWKRSAVIVNNESFSYWNDVGAFQATASGFQEQWTNSVSISHGDITGEITRNEPVSFIPPASFKERTPVVLNPDFITLKGSKADHRDVFTINQQPVSGLQYEYLREDSPFRYRSYLTVSTDQDFKNSQVYESEFWISDLFQTFVSPRLFYQEAQNRNKFYISNKRKRRAGVDAVVMSVQTAPQTF
jgi:hypothetical protein